MKTIINSIHFETRLSVLNGKGRYRLYQNKKQTSYNCSFEFKIQRRMTTCLCGGAGTLTTVTLVDCCCMTRGGWGGAGLYGCGG